jgi:hypothetical protein
MLAAAYADVWTWFQKNEQPFYRVVREHQDIEQGFFNLLAPRLDAVHDGLFFLAGMCDDDRAELVITADGTVKNIVFVEELIRAAPALPNWQFTALKPATDITDVVIQMSGYEFSAEHLSFYANELPAYPDEIDITVVHADLTAENRDTITNGTYIFLDNYLGELDFVSHIDNLEVVGKAEAQKELVPIDKLKGFLTWRQKEFVEKYEGVRHQTESEEDEFSILEAELENGNKLLAIINTGLLQWDRKASHPWILSIEINYDGSRHHGMPDNDTFPLLDEIEENILAGLQDPEGCLYIGRQTAEQVREIYFACQDFRKPSKVMYQVQTFYAGRVKMDYALYIDKYWQSFNRFMPEI